MLIRKFFRTDKAWIAGGALRDLDNDKEIKDIDIFIHAEDRIARQCLMARSTNRAFSFVSQLEGLYKTKAINEFKKYQNFPSSLKLHNIETFPHNPYPIQLIFYNHPGNKGPKVLLDYFDIGLCEISYDGERVYRTDTYKSCIQNKQITINPLFARHEHTHQRVKYLQKKYPDFIVSETPDVFSEPTTVSNSRPIDWDILWSPLTTQPITWTTRPTGPVGAE